MKRDDEMLVLVDLLDREIGYMEKLEAHKEGRLHRAFSIFILDGDRILLQRRNRGKYHSGGLWTNTCCSHPRKGEELTQAIHRRLFEEIGFDTELTEIDSFVYRAAFANGLTEYEYDHVFTGRYSGQELLPDPGEVEEVRWISVDELLREMQEHPETFTAWFITAAPKVVRRMRETGCLGI